MNDLVVWEEKSARGSVARLLLRIVAVVARITTELEELKRSENSASLWKLHVDSLLALLEVARALSENTARLVPKDKKTADNAGEETINLSLQRLAQRSELVIPALTGAASETLTV